MSSSSNVGKLLDAAVTAIKALSLSGITSTNIVQMQLPTDEKASLPGLPGIVVASVDAETFDGGTNASDDIGYPLAIIIVDAANGEQATSADARRVWRQKIVDHFVHNRLSVSLSAGFLLDQRVEPGPQIDAAAWIQANLFVSSIAAVRCVVRQRRRAA